jgi:hypothetical protein
VKRARVSLLLLAAAALVALASVEHPPGPSAATDMARATSARPRVPGEKSEASETLQFGSAFIRQPLPQADDAFQTRSWAPPPPVAKAPPAKPVAPPLPYSFSGLMEDEHGRTLFLRRGDALLVGHEHDVVDANYRVEEIGDTSAVLTYLPLKERQVLAYPK